MPVLENPRHETFAQGVASGLTAVEAYERAGYRGGGSHAWRLQGTEEVRARVRELQEITSARAGMSREEAVAMCIEILKAPPSAAHLEHPLCELKMGKDGPYAIFPDKRGVMERLAKMLGWDEPEKHDVQLTGPRGVLAAVMGRGKREKG